MFTKTEAIVLHQLKYGETRVIVDMFTRQTGRQSFIVSLPKSTRSKFKKQLFQPLSLLNIEYDQRAQAQLQKVSEVSLLSPLPSLLCQPEKVSIALFVAEFLYHALRSEQQNTPLFDYIRSSIEWLDGCEEHYANFHLVFLMRLSRFLGFYPNLDDYAEGDYFDLRESRFAGQPPVHRDFLEPADAARLRTMMRMDYTSMHLFRLSRLDRNRLLDVALTYYRLHLPDFPELRSLSVLQELYAP